MNEFKRLRGDHGCAIATGGPPVWRRLFPPSHRGWRQRRLSRRRKGGAAASLPLPRKCGLAYGPEEMNSGLGAVTSYSASQVAEPGQMNPSFLMSSRDSEASTVAGLPPVIDS